MRIEQAVGNRQGQRTDIKSEEKESELVPKFAQVDSGTKTSEIAAKAVDMNRETYRQAKAVVETGDEDLIRQNTPNGHRQEIN